MITVNDLKNRDNFFLMAGPCAIEGEDMALRIAYCRESSRYHE